MKTNILFFVLFLGTLSVSNAQLARLQVIHNSADLAAQQVDVYLNGAILLDDFAFRTATPFINAPAGVPLLIQIAPSTSMSAAESIADFTLTLTVNETYIVVANGIVSPTGYSPATPFNLHVYPMGRETSSGMNTTDVIVFHGATDAPVVDVNEITLGGATIIDGMAYSDFTGYLSLPVNDYGLQILPDDQSVVVAEYLAPLSTLGLGGSAITVLASGFLNPAVNSNGPAFGLFVALPSGGALVELPSIEYSRLQVIHNSADMAAEEVDVYLNGNLLLDDFAFRTATPFIDIASDLEHMISIAPSTSTSVNDAIADFPVMFEEGEIYIVVANGIVSPTGYSPATPFNLHVYPMGRETSSGMNTTDVLVFHGATDAPAVDVVEVAFNAGTLIDDFSYGDFAGYLELAVANYTLDVRAADQSATVASYGVPLESLNLGGLALTVVASGFLNPLVNSNGPAFGLWVALPAGGQLVQLPVTTGIIGNEFSEKMRIYPNPATDYIVVETSNQSNNNSIQISDITGKSVMQFSTTGSETLDISQLQSGTYMMRIISGNANHVEKIIIQK